MSFDSRLGAPPPKGFFPRFVVIDSSPGGGLQTTDFQVVVCSSTPAFFVNGRFLSGAQPFNSFKVLIDEEISAN